MAPVIPACIPFALRAESAADTRPMGETGAATTSDSGHASSNSGAVEQARI